MFEIPELVPIITNRSRSINALAEEICQAWGYDLSKRRPGVAYVMEDGSPVTDLDMACLMSELYRWGSVINIPEYERSGPATRTEGQVVVGGGRHGKITGLTSHKDHFNFGVRIWDMAVMSAKDVGAYRTFLLVRNAVWYPGMDHIEFIPTPEEKERLATIAQAGNKITFSYFVHPLRWTSFYGAPYLLGKMLIERLTDEISFMKKGLSMMAAELNLSGTEYPEKEVGPTIPENLWVFSSEVRGPALEGSYPEMKGPVTLELFKQTSDLKDRLTKLKEVLKFQTRATEYSFFLQLCKVLSPANLIPWVQGELKDSPKVPKAAWAKGAWKAGVLDKKTPWVVMDEVQHGLGMRFRIRIKEQGKLGK